jgi:hypothetical protein
MQSIVIKMYSILCRLALQGTWLLNDAVTRKILIAAHVRGISILERDSSFGSLENNEQSIIVPTFLNLNTLNDINRNIETDQANSNNAGYIHYSPLSNKNRKATRISLAPKPKISKLFPIPLNQNFMNPPVSTGQKDAGLGLPTFAVLSTEIQLKSAAESSMSMITAHFANFPPKNSCLGVTKLDSAWNETNFVAKQRAYGIDIGMGEEKNAVSMYVRYFTYQKRLILGMVEIPPWVSKEKDALNPKIVLSIRDANGKFSWMGELEFKESPSPLELSLNDLPEFTPFPHVFLQPKTEAVLVNSVNEAFIPTFTDCCEVFGPDYDVESELKRIQLQHEVEKDTLKKHDSIIQLPPLPNDDFIMYYLFN